MITKICSKCAITKSIDGFHNRADGVHGVHAECKPCSSLRRRANYLKNKDKCLAKNKEYAEANKAAIDEYQKRYREENKDSLFEYKRKWAEDNSLTIKVSKAANYQDNRELRLKQVGAYQKVNRHICNAAAAKYKAAKLQATPSWMGRGIIRVIYKEAKLHNLHVDHIVPLQSKLVCGLHWEGNLQLLSVTDNCSKSNVHWPDMWET